MRGFAMRLFHMGRNVAVWGDMTTPEVGPAIFSSFGGPGDLATAEILAGIAAKAGARTALVTAQPSGELVAHVDVVTVFPRKRWPTTGRQAFGPADGFAFETAQMISFELAILKLRPRFGETAETMRARHTNLE